MEKTAGGTGRGWKLEMWLHQVKVLKRTSMKAIWVGCLNLSLCIEMVLKVAGLMGYLGVSVG